MAKETLRDKVARLEAENERLAKDFNDCLAENGQLQRQLNAQVAETVEETDAYKKLAKQLQQVETQRDTAIKQRERYREKVLKLEDERESWQRQSIQAEDVEQLQNQLDASRKAQDALQEALDAAQEELQQIKATQVHNARGAGRKPKLTDDQEQKIKQLRSEGRTMKEISKRIGCSIGLVYNTIQKLNNEQK